MANRNNTVISRTSAVVVLLIAFFTTTVDCQVQTDLSHLGQCNASNPQILDGIKPYQRIRIQRAYDFFAAQALPFHPVTIGVVDSGIDRLHQEFRGVNIQTSFFAALDLWGHGTSVTGIIGANNLGSTTCTTSNQRQMNGVLSGFSSSYSMDVRGFTLLPTLTVPQVTSLLDTLGKLQIPVVNVSWGKNRSTFTSADAFSNTTESFRRIVMAHPDTLFVFAAGESDLDATNVVPANLGGTNGLSNVLTVSATDPKNDSRASAPGLANWGASVDLSAPGTKVYAPSVGWNLFSLFVTGPAYANFSGTSASAPLVSGVAAALKGINPNLAASDIKQLIVDSADAISTDKFIGNKSLNACRAVKRALSTLDPPPPLLLSPANNAVISLNVSTGSGSGSGYSIQLIWSDVSSQACNPGVGYQLAVNNNGQQFTGGSFSTTSFNLTVPSPPPTGFGLTGWTWTVTTVDPFNNRTSSGTGTFSLQPPVSIPPPDLTITKTANANSVTSGGTLTYTITVQNATGTAGAQNVIVTDPLQGGLSYVSCSVPDGGACAPSGGIPTATFSSLAGGASVRFIISATAPTVTTSTQVANTATVSADNEPPANTANNKATQTATVNPVLSFSRHDLILGGNPLGVASADFNGDGKQDLAVLYGPSGATRTFVAMFLGNGDGTFTLLNTFDTGFAAPWLITADLNQDNKPDLVVANGFGRSISVLLGNGDGTFGTSNVIPLPGRIESVIAADFNGDGKLDLAAPDFEPQPYAVSILLGNGDGTFGPNTDFPTLDVPYVVIADDFNHDGKLDLAVNGQFGGVSVLLGNGDGTFQPKVDSSTGFAQSSHIASGDFNNDGKPDLVVTNNADDSVSILLGNNDGTFTLQPSIALPVTPFRVLVRDVDRDGKLDLVVVRRNSATLSILTGKGDGTFGSPTDFSTGLGPQFVVVNDLNGDGKPDLVTPNEDDGTITVLLNTSQ